jgi:hypothetical protein
MRERAKMPVDRWWEGFATLADVFFNGRPAKQVAAPNVTVQELIRRKTSHILLEGKLYRVEVREISVSESKQDGT